MVPFLSFDYQDKLYRKELIDAMTGVLDSKWYILGNQVAQFEENYASAHGVPHALGVANGLDALIIALKVLGIAEGDEVIVPSNTYIATWLAVSTVGAIPIPVEPDEKTYNINPKLIEQAITKKTKAILPVHLYGQACDMDAIMSIARSNNLFVVEDNAQAHFSSWNGKMTGTFGDINATSFYPGKNLGAMGDGGGLTTHNSNLYEKARIYRNYGSQKKYYNEIKGINSRLDELQAAILNVKLPHLKGLTQQRQQIAKALDNSLKDSTKIILPFVADKAEHVYHIYMILSEHRDELQRHLKEKGVDTLIHYPVPPHLQEAYKDLGYRRGDFPIAEKIAEQCLSLPMFPGMTDVEIGEVSTAIKMF